MLGFRNLLSKLNPYTTMDKCPDWPKCKTCGLPVETYLIIFNKVVIMKCKGETC